MKGMPNANLTQMAPAMKKKSTLHVKFANEVHFCFGVAMINDDGKDVGARFPPFECTGKKAILHHKHEELA